MRRQLRRLEKGVCQGCGLDTGALRRAFNACMRREVQSAEREVSWREARVREAEQLLEEAVGAREQEAEMDDLVQLAASAGAAEDDE